MGATCTLHLTQWMFEQICAHCVETILIDSVMWFVHVYRDGYTWMDGWMQWQGWERGNNGFGGRAMVGGGDKELLLGFFKFCPKLCHWASLVCVRVRQWQGLILTNEHRV